MKSLVYERQVCLSTKMKQRFQLAPQMRKAGFWPENSKVFSSYTQDLFTQGIVCSGLAYYIQGVVMKDRGPVFVTAFNPLSMIIVAVMSSFILAEQMYLGRYSLSSLLHHNHTYPHNHRTKKQANVIYLQGNRCHCHSSWPILCRVG